MNKTILIIGAGPAGLTSALLLARKGYQVKVYESDPSDVGGLSRTLKHRGYRMDIGGHRFYTKDPEVQQFWREILGSDLLIRKRVSRIFYNRRYLDYPLKPFDLIRKLSPVESISFIFSYVRSQFDFGEKPHNFENWVIRKFGRKLYLAFFKSYTEKVWGMDCKDISADWAVQRINNLNIGSILKRFLLETFRIKRNNIKSLIEEFEYPVEGPGMLWEKVAREIELLGGEVIMGVRVKSSVQDPESEKWTLELEDGRRSPAGDHLISTAPMREFIKHLRPAPHYDLLQSMDDFRYRGFITVAVMFKGANPFPDNWIYIHDNRVQVARIQNYQNWSSAMTPGGDHVCLGLEYFCQQGDDFWQMTDHQLFALARHELALLKLVDVHTVDDFKVIRCPHAYPVYDMNYKKRLESVKTYISRFSNLHLIGRNGLHRYNNQDHSIKTAMLICENIELGRKKYDPWNVNQDAEYIEEVKVNPSVSVALS